MLLTINEIKQKTKEISEIEKIEVKGWVKSVRKSKKIFFVVLNDGSTLSNLQIIISPENISQIDWSKINLGSSLIVSGKLLITQGREQNFELHAIKFEIISSTDKRYPLQKKALSLEIVRNYPHLRAKTNYFLAMFRLRHSLSLAIHDFFNQRNFYYLNTSIITNNNAEGSFDNFTVIHRSNSEQGDDFFANKAKLTVSGQLQLEAFAQGMGRVYNFGPCFRAEKSHTTRHLAEFWMVEPEVAFAKLSDILELAEKLVKYLINYSLDNNYEELEYFSKYKKIEIINKLKNIVKYPFQKITYKEAIKIIDKNKKNFIQKNIYWGMDLQSEHEKYVCQYFDKPVFITDYPINLKAFYMKNNEDGETVAAMDLLVPGIGELIGGSERENNHKILKEKAQKANLNIDNLNWYLDLRKFGFANTAGFGMGFERFLMFLTNEENIRDVIPIPIYHKHLEF